LISKKHILLIIFLLILIAVNSIAQKSDQISGSILFRDYCAACHKPGSELIGPDIRNIRDKRDLNWIFSFVQNSQKLILNKDKEALNVFTDYKKVVMPANPLNNDEITSILNYVDTVRSINYFFSDTSEVSRSKLAPLKSKPGFPKISIILILTGIFILILIGINRYWHLKPGFIISFDKFFTHYLSKSFLIFPVFIIFIDCGLYFYRLNYFNQQEKIIQITQPIRFSHESHYNTYKIECISCHKNAIKTQFAGLPDLKSCMKCHGYIKKGIESGQVEIVKLYKLYYAKKGINWNEGYRISQYAHFDHSQHTVSGKLKCTVCHTNPAMIEVSKLEFKMAWCINCHQTKNVDFSNKYYQRIYDSTFISKHPTVAVIGGTDCSQCHY
jgi:cytochrome c551/c552